MILPPILQRWFGPDAPLGTRVGASAFLVGLAAMLVTGGLSMAISLSAIPRAELAAHRQAAQLLAVQMTGRIMAHVQVADSIANSALVWTAISDSYGREAYLRPYLQEQEKSLRGSRMLLLDYRARPLFGTKFPADTPEAELTRQAWRVIEEKRPVMRLYDTKRPYLALAYPVVYPYSGDPIGVLLALIDLDQLFAPLADALDAGGRLRLMSGGKTLASFPLEAQSHQPAQQRLMLPDAMADIDLALEYASRENAWLGTFTMQAAVHLLLALLLGTGIWLLARRAAQRLTARLSTLAEACDAITPGQPPGLPEDPANDEIGRLNRALRQALDAHARLDRELESRIAEQTRELRESEQALRRAQEVAHLGSWEICPASETLRWSEETYRIFGLAPDTPIDFALFLSCVHPDDRALVDASWKAALAGAHYDFAHRIVVGQRVKWVRERAELEFDAAGAFKAGIGTIQDITVQVETEEALRQASAAAEAANRAKSVFLATMSHEIRTPLNAVIGFSHLAREEAASADLRDYLDKIESAGKSLLAIINDILDFSKIEAGRVQVERVPFDPRELVADVRRQVELDVADKGLTLRTAVDDELPALLAGDPLRLRQILLNLLINAIKFTPAGEVSLRAGMENGKFICRVSDTGIGIDAHQLGQLFMPFAQADSSITRNYGGSGLGLAISRRLAILMGGTLDALSTPGQGSTFTLYLPLDVASGDAEPPVANQATAPASRASLAGARVLLVEDNVVNQQIGVKLLAKLGIDAAVATNGEEALALLDQGAFDLVLMDIHMPVMDGLEATRRIRAKHSFMALPIVAMTADAFAEDRERCLAAGMNDHLAKPLDFTVFADTLRRWLRR
ncbi:MAG: ATP-binding protein [Pseudomonadota bacterium]